MNIKANAPVHLIVADNESMNVQELIRSLLMATTTTVIPVLVLHDSDRANPSAAIREGRFAYAKPGAYEPVVVDGIPAIALFVEHELVDMNEAEESELGEDDDA